jgi:hypothetical protein
MDIYAGQRELQSPTASKPPNLRKSGKHSKMQARSVMFTTQVVWDQDLLHIGAPWQNELQQEQSCIMSLLFARQRERARSWWSGEGKDSTFDCTKSAELRWESRTHHDHYASECAAFDDFSQIVSFRWQYHIGMLLSNNGCHILGPSTNPATWHHINLFEYISFAFFGWPWAPLPPQTYYNFT